MNDYNRLSKFANLYAAHLKTRLGKRHKAEVIRFEVNLGFNLTLLSHMLEDDVYLPVQYYNFKVFEPKERDIHALRYPDRVVQRCLCDQVLLPAIEPRLIHDNAACRKGKGVHFSLDRLSRFMREHYRLFGNKGYALKCDIHKYFQSVLQCYEDAPGRGLPLGNQSSQWFALYYLDEVDRLIKERLRVKHYVRYMDDFILLHPSKAFLVDAKLRIEELLCERLSLRLNNKTKLVPLSCGIDYLGFHSRLTDSGKVLRRLLPAAKRRMKRSLRGLRSGLAKGLLTPDELSQSIASYRGHLSHGSCQGLISKLISPPGALLYTTHTHPVAPHALHIY